MLMQCINGDLIMTDDEFRRADLDGNGTLNSLDLLKAQQQILGYGEISGTGWYNCDTNSDNKIDATDLTAIQMVIVGLATIES